MSRELENKVVLITGAASGIGAACAELFAREGARVGVADVSLDAADALAAAIREAGGEAIGIACDVTRGAQVDAAVAQLVATWGRLDCAVNNAGITVPLAPIAELEEADYERLMAVNVKGVWLSMRAEIRQMLTQGGGSIVNMASALSHKVHPGASFYVASKFAVAGMTRTAAVEYGESGIRINGLCPGNIRTPMLENAVTDPAAVAALQALHPMNRLGTPGEIAQAALWLASDRASFTTGALLTADGGWTAR
ncbi:MAG TPA: glucose 1-dehydrogenase [Porticoccaceae bacterium]|nr:glucose 1-dehydrogenase [Porticoccaceae bacterium]